MKTTLLALGLLCAVSSLALADESYTVTPIGNSWYMIIMSDLVPVPDDPLDEFRGHAFADKEEGPLGMIPLQKWKNRIEALCSRPIVKGYRDQGLTGLDTTNSLAGQTIAFSFADLEDRHGDSWNYE